jgi:hypothetical protein
MSDNYLQAYETSDNKWSAVVSDLIGKLGRPAVGHTLSNYENLSFGGNQCLFFSIWRESKLSDAVNKIGGWTL